MLGNLKAKSQVKIETLKKVIDIHSYNNTQATELRAEVSP